MVSVSLLINFVVFFKDSYNRYKYIFDHGFVLDSTGLSYASTLPVSTWGASIVL